MTETPFPEATAPRFPIVAKTFAGLEDVLAEELRALPGASNVEQGNRMVSFEGTLETLYRANMCCRTAVRILKPIESFTADNTDELYDRLKEMNWGEIVGTDHTFSIDSVVYSSVFTNSRYVTYRFKDAIVDWFRDRYGDAHRPRVRLDGADMMLNIHIAERRVTVSLDSSGESLHRRGWRTDTTEAPINEVLAAGIILKTGWRGDTDFVDPMCGSGTFLIEAAMIAANIMPGIYRKSFAFESWPDFNPELLESIYNDDSAERDNFKGRIYGSDISSAVLRVTEQNLKSAGVARFVTLGHKDIADIKEAPAPEGVLVTNPPYGKRLRPADLDGLYRSLGSMLKNAFQGWSAWIIGYGTDAFNAIGLAPSKKETLYNGSLVCQLREYVMFKGNYKDFRAQGGSLGKQDDKAEQAADRKGPKPDFKRERKQEYRPADRFKGKGNPRYSREGDKGGFKRGDDRGPRTPGERFRREFERDDKRRFERAGEEGKRGFQRRPSEAEELLGRRFNPYALRSITGKQPRLEGDGSVTKDDAAPRRQRRRDR